MSDSGQEDDSQKTEDPTAKKLEESRKKGQVALIREVNNWVMLFTGTIVILAIGPGAMSSLTDFMKTFIERAHAMPSAPGGIGVVLGQSFWEVISILVVPLIVLMIAITVLLVLIWRVQRCILVWLVLPWCLLKQSCLWCLRFRKELQSKGVARVGLTFAITVLLVLLSCLQGIIKVELALRSFV